MTIDWSGKTALAAPLCLYIATALCLGLQPPGLQYDEALLVEGAVHVIHSPGPPPFAASPGSWFVFAGKHWPLMVLPYIGAVKAYLLLPVYAIAGPSVIVTRLVSVLLGAAAIFGLGYFLWDQLGRGVALIVCTIFAIHPAYLDLTIYDNSALPVWMAAQSLALVFLAIYLRKPAVATACAIGIALGLTIWVRANIAWTIAAVFIAALIVFNRRLVVPLRHIAAFIAGGVAGCSPLLLYEYLSKGGTFEFLSASSHAIPLALIQRRLYIAAEVMISDELHRRIWNGPPYIPTWQIATLTLIISVALLFCLFSRRGDASVIRWRRFLAITYMVLLAMMMSTRQNLNAHHLIALLPFAAVMIVLTCKALLQISPNLRVVVAAVAIFYVGCAAYWNISAAREIRRTGGYEVWSDAISQISDHVQQYYRGRPLKVLDWGFANSIYILSNARIPCAEMFWTATSNQVTPSRTWRDELREGGLYLVNVGAHPAFPAARDGLFAALGEGQYVTNRVQFPQRDGTPYAELIEVVPQKQ